MPELPPVIATFLGNVTDLKAKLGEAEESLTGTATLSEAKMAEIEASVDKQVAEMATAAEAAGTEFDATATKAELMATKTEAASEKSSTAFTKLQSVGKVALLGIAGAAVGVGFEAVKSADTFSKSMAGIQGSAQITAGQANAIGNAFLSTAGKTTVSAQEMATAFAPVSGVVKSLNGGVLTASASLDVMKAATTASEASGLSLSSTTKDLTGVMQAFKIPVSDAAETTNTLFNASRITGTSIDTLSSTVEKLHTKLGPVAPDLSQTSALMVDLAKNGVVGSKGAMAINTGMTTLLGGSKATSTELKALGVNVYDASGKFVGMQSTLAQLQPKLAGMSDAQQKAAESALFGAGAANAMNLVVQGGVTGFNAATAAVNAKGAAEDAASAKAHTLSGETEMLKSAIEDAYVKIGEHLIPILQKVIAVGIEWGTWLGKHKIVLEALGFVVGVVLVAAIGAYIAGLVAAAAAQLVALAPIIAIVAACALLAAGIYELYTHWSTIWDDIKSVASAAGNFVEGVFNHIWSFLKTWGPLILTVIAPFIGIPLLIAQHWSTITSFFSGLWGDVEGVFTTALGWLYAWFVGIPLKAVAALGNLVSTLVGKGKDLIDGLVSGIVTAWNNEVAFWTGLGSKIIGYLDGAVHWLENVGKNIITGLWNGIGNEMGWLEGKIKGIGGSVVGWAKDALSIFSPSKVMADEVGQWIPKGIAAGITDNSTVVKTAVTDTTTGAINGGLAGLTSGVRVTPAAAPVGAADGAAPQITIMITQPLASSEDIFNAVQAAFLQHGSFNSQSYQPFVRK